MQIDTLPQCPIASVQVVVTGTLKTRIHPLEAASRLAIVPVHLEQRVL